MTTAAKQSHHKSETIASASQSGVLSELAVVATRQRELLRLLNALGEACDRSMEADEPERMGQILEDRASVVEHVSDAAKRIVELTAAFSVGAAPGAELAGAGEDERALLAEVDELMFQVTTGDAQRCKRLEQARDVLAESAGRARAGASAANAYARGPALAAGTGGVFGAETQA